MPSLLALCLSLAFTSSLPAQAEEGATQSSTGEFAETWQTLWSIPLKGGSTPIEAGDHLYAWGYQGEGRELREVMLKLDKTSGEVLWTVDFRDFLSDIIYNRYGIGTPAYDPASDTLYTLTSPGELVAISGDGEIKWSVSLMERYGRLTFPNGRTGGPILVGDLVITHNILTNWGSQGPARDRFQAFDANTGELVWTSTPGTAPKDSSFSQPVVAQYRGKTALFAGTGCGHLVAIDIATGQPLWRAPLSKGGVNVRPLLMGDTLIGVHAKENLDSTKIGGMFAFSLSEAPPLNEEDPKAVPVFDAPLWRNDLVAFSSSPFASSPELFFQVSQTGKLHGVDPATGAVLWELPLAADQLHADPVALGNRLLIPTHDGVLHIVEANADGARPLARIPLDGKALSAPLPLEGSEDVVITTTAGTYRLHPTVGGAVYTPEPQVSESPAPSSEVSAIRILPAEVVLQPGESTTVTVQQVNEEGDVLGIAKDLTWERWIPPTAKVRATMEAEFTNPTTLTAPEDASMSAGAFKVTTADGFTATLRGRTVPPTTFSATFDAYELSAQGSSGAFAWPPLPWIGARLKWQIREVDGERVLAKTLDRMLFQRSTVFFGHPEATDYVISADVRTDGNRRSRSTIGLINQRYLVALKGNQRRLEVSSNQDRLKVGVPFDFQPDTWYRLKVRVDREDSGLGVIRAKAWPRDAAEPEDWTLVVEDPEAHTHGAPGLFGFTPQNNHAVYLDNLQVNPVEESP